MPQLAAFKVSCVQAVVTGNELEHEATNDGSATLPANLHLFLCILPYLTCTYIVIGLYDLTGR
jgi:hypothetical protein